MVSRTVSLCPRILRGVKLRGVLVSSWATSGGNFTGGEEVVGGILRSLMGMDGFAFTLGQKLVVFATDEHNRPAGEFSLRDAWFMDLFARRIALAAASKLDAARAHDLAIELGLSESYFHSFPLDKTVLRKRCVRMP